MLTALLIVAALAAGALAYAFARNAAAERQRAEVQRDLAAAEQGRLDAQANLERLSQRAAALADECQRRQEVIAELHRKLDAIELELRRRESPMDRADRLGRTH